MQGQELLIPRILKPTHYNCIACTSCSLRVTLPGRPTACCPARVTFDVRTVYICTGAYVLCGYHGMQRVRQTGAQAVCNESTFLSVLICSSWEMGTLSSCRGASMKSSPLQRACTSQRTCKDCTRPHRQPATHADHLSLVHPSTCNISSSSLTPLGMHGRPALCMLCII